MVRENVIGNKYGRLTVIEDAPDKVYKNGAHDRVEKCLCDCGKIKFVKLGQLKSGHTRSCGCYHDERCRERQITHGMTGTRLYRIWCMMKSRCSNPNMDYYYLYGGKGISVCDEWRNSFDSFSKWSIGHGYNDSLTIDRIDSNKDYCPENCRWVTFKKQANNTSRNHLLEYNGGIYTLAELSEIVNIPYSTLRHRIYDGMSVYSAIEKPHRTSKKARDFLITANGESRTGTDWAEIVGLGKSSINRYVRVYGVDNVVKLIEAMLSEPKLRHRRGKQTWFDVYGVEVKEDK